MCAGAWQEVGAALVKNLNLVHLDLSGNHFSAAVLKVLAASLCENHTILGLHLEGESHGYVDSHGFIRVHKPRCVVLHRVTSRWVGLGWIASHVRVRVSI